MAELYSLNLEKILCKKNGNLNIAFEFWLPVVAFVALRHQHYFILINIVWQSKKQLQSVFIVTIYGYLLHIR